MGSGGFGGVTWVLGDVGVGAWVLGPEGPEGEEVCAAGAKILGFGKYGTQIPNRKMTSQTVIFENFRRCAAAIYRYNKASTVLRPYKRTANRTTGR